MTVLEMRKRAAELVARASDEMSPDELRALETEHADLVRQIAAAETAAWGGLRSRFGGVLGGETMERIAALPAIERRAALIDALADHEAAMPETRSAIGADHMPQRNAEISQRAAMAEALFARIDPRFEPSQAARPYIGLGLDEIARRCLATAGHSVLGISSAQAVSRGLHATADFPLILSDVTQRVLAAAYAAAPAALERIARRTSAPDFRARKVLQLSEASELEKVVEHGEYKRGSFVEGGEAYRVETYGKVFGITRQALINDDLSAFTTVPERLAAAGRAHVAKLLADLLNSPPTMSDGKSVFHADHKNLAAVSAAPSIDSLSAARRAMREQVGLSGALIDIVPAFIVVPPALETAAEQLVASITPATASAANPFSGKLEVVCEPRLTDAKAWYLAASPATAPGIEFAYLEGAEGPQLETRQGFGVDGLEMKVRVDVGAGWTDHRAWHKNAGA